MELKEISRLAQRQLSLEHTLGVAENRVKEVKEDLRKVAEVDLPEAMEAAEMEDFTLQDGSKVSIKLKYAAAISKANADAAFSWLRKNNFDGIIKRTVSMKFGKGEDDDAGEAIGLLEGAGFTVEDKPDVHSSTLRAFVKEQLEQGVDLPMELFGVHKIIRAVIQRASE